MKSRCSSGFSLIELVMASLIASAAGALLVGGLVAANRSTEYRVSQLLSTQWLANQLALLDDRLGEATPVSGTIPPGSAGWTLAIQVADDSPAPLVTATITVTQKGAANRAVTYRLPAAP